MPGLKVFVSSTFVDLQAERRQVLEAIESLRLEHRSMEYFGATEERPLDTCLNEVRQSDTFFLIIGHCYGTVDNSTGISYSEAEYKEARRLKLPCYVFVASDDMSVRPKDIERDPEKLRALQAWKARLCTDHTVAYFANAVELVTRVMAALTRVAAAYEAVQAKVQPDDPANAHARVAREVADLVSLGTDRGYPMAVLISVMRAALGEFLQISSRLTTHVVVLAADVDIEVTRRVATALEAEGADVWIESLSPQSPTIAGHLTSVLESAEVAVFLLSVNTPTEPWISAEMQAAVWRFMSAPDSVCVVPVALQADAIPPLFRALPHVDLYGGDGSPAAVVRAVRDYTLRRKERAVRVVGRKM